VGGSPTEVAITRMKRSTNKRTRSDDRVRAGRRQHGAPKQHLVADLWGCRADALRDEAAVRATMTDAAVQAGATVVDTTFHTFPGGGVTGVVSVKESHLSVHTWPEQGYAALDVFLCGATKPRRALQVLVDAFGATRTMVRELDRGTRPGEERSATAPVRMPLLYVLTLVVAMCSIVYELLLAQTLSALLGNTVLRYSITIGCYLGALGVGAMLCGTSPRAAAGRLTRVEIALSALGGLSVPLFYLLDAGQRILWLDTPSGSFSEALVPVVFLLATHAVIIGIGLLSGFEIPLLLSLGEDSRPGSTNRILGVDYFGALVGSVLFPVVGLRWMGLISTGFAVALLNVAAALMLLLWAKLGRSWRLVGSCAATALALVVGLANADRIEEHFLKKFYYVEDLERLSDVFALQRNRPRIERHRSAYQTIDLVHSRAQDQWVFDVVSRRHERTRDYPRDLWLYLDREYQLYSGSEEFYHEWFVHVPFQIRGVPPRRVLVLGGGDGLALREILKYDGLERVVHVDIDPEMIRLSGTHPLLVSLNGHPDDDPRVELVLGDAFQWLRTGTERFDAVFIDVPMARNYNLAMLYSREFYSLVRHRLAPGGFVALDAPDGSCDIENSLWPVYASTLHAAGFQTVLSILSRVDFEAPSIAGALDRLAQNTALQLATPGGGSIRATPAQARKYLEEYAEEEIVPQEFILAFPHRRSPELVWHDFGIPLDALRPRHLPLAVPTCADHDDPHLVNSIFRPTLPPLELLSVLFP
jgi:spermidine synthase